MRIFVDANILFSAAKTDGAIRQLVGLLRAAGHELWADGYVLEEARRNLHAKAPDGLHALEAIVAFVAGAAVLTFSTAFGSAAVGLFTWAVIGRDALARKELLDAGVEVEAAAKATAAEAALALEAVVTRHVGATLLAFGAATRGRSAVSPRAFFRVGAGPRLRVLRRLL